MSESVFNGHRPSRYGHRLHGGGSSAAMASQHDLMGSVAIVDDHDAIHAAVELWCSQAQPPIRFVGKYFSAEQFLDEHPSPSASGVGPVVLELRMERNGVDSVKAAQTAAYWARLQARPGFQAAKASQLRHAPAGAEVSPMRSQG